MLADLHTHTNASDGSLSPDDLLDRASAAGVTLLAITDHDTTAAYATLTAPKRAALRLIGGIEFSTFWQRQGVHIVGLNIDPDHAAMHAACTSQRASRQQRAEAIAERLRKQGVSGAYEGAASFAANDNIGRPHFAAYLVSIGAVTTAQQAFRKYLGGRHDAAGLDHWAPMPEVINWIRGAGGTAVLAHPSKYGLTHRKMNALTRAFRDSGGEAIEVVSGGQSEELTRTLAQLCQRHELAASVGSDFHEPGKAWAALGKMPALPADLQPVWDLW